MVPLPGSPAIGAGSVAAASAFATDQRGLLRIVGGKVDIGAVEVQPPLAGSPPLIVGLTYLPNGSLEFSFTNTTGVSFDVFAATNAALPFDQWSDIGNAAENPTGSGQFYFTDTLATNYTRRFYRVRSP